MKSTPVTLGGEADNRGDTWTIRRGCDEQSPYSGTVGSSNSMLEPQRHPTLAFQWVFCLTRGRPSDRPEANRTCETIGWCL